MQMLLWLCDSFQKALLLCADFFFLIMRKRKPLMALGDHLRPHWGWFRLNNMQSFVRARVRVCVVLLIYSYPRRKCVQHSTCSSNFLAEYVEIEIKEPCNRMHRHAPRITVVLWEGMQGPMQTYPQEHSPRPIFHLTLKNISAFLLWLSFPGV